jgi:hypothetical protein
MFNPFDANNLCQISSCIIKSYESLVIRRNGA